MNLTDELGLVVRQLVRQALDLPAQSVRPSDQAAPAGAQTEQIVTVKILTGEDASEPSLELENVGTDDDPDYEEASYVPQVFTASVQVFRGRQADAAGIAKYTTEAFDLARRLPQRLGLSKFVTLMQVAGLGYMGASPARNLAGVVDRTWESRGSIDLTFNVISREAVSVAVFASQEIGLQVLEPGGAIHTIPIEVTP